MPRGPSLLGSPGGCLAGAGAGDVGRQLRIRIVRLLGSGVGFLATRQERQGFVLVHRGGRGGGELGQTDGKGCRGLYLAVPREAGRRDNDGPAAGGGPVMEPI
ncbi:hypothetical protein [Streptomyces sp. NPDC055287]